jgi:ornithine cyclodeaminase
MLNSEILILSGQDVSSILTGRETEIIDAVRTAYEAHTDGDSSLPHSLFLRFPNEPENRIIALPAYVGREFQTAGLKWISSFPGNLVKGIDRASSVIILNSLLTGRPEAIIEGSLISAKRTAASAALAAHTLRGAAAYSELGLLGCGLINFEIMKFLFVTCPEIESVTLYDVDGARANHCREKGQEILSGKDVRIAKSADDILEKCSLVSIATTALRPHISDVSKCRRGSVILHVSLRDLAPETILSSDNVVDDVDHVCRAQTSVHLAEQLIGDRNFIRCALGDILKGRAAPRRDEESVVIFSPFGLGILDIAVSKMIRDTAIAEGRGVGIPSFFPAQYVGSNL